MTFPSELGYPLILAGLGATGAWVRSVESRINQHQAVIDKIDQLVSLLLEDRLDSDRHNQKRPHPRRGEEG